VIAGRADGAGPSAADLVARGGLAIEVGGDVEVPPEFCRVERRFGDRSRRGCRGPPRVLSRGGAVRRRKSEGMSRSPPSSVAWRGGSAIEVGGDVEVPPEFCRVEQSRRPRPRRRAFSARAKSASAVPRRNSQSTSFARASMACRHASRSAWQWVRRPAATLAASGPWNRSRRACCRPGACPPPRSAGSRTSPGASPNRPANHGASPRHGAPIRARHAAGPTPPADRTTTRHHARTAQNASPRHRAPHRAPREGTGGRAGAEATARFGPGGCAAAGQPRANARARRGPAPAAAFAVAGMSVGGAPRPHARISPRLASDTQRPPPSTM
jgi:hypothetical protein